MSERRKERTMKKMKAAAALFYIATALLYTAALIALFAAHKAVWGLPLLCAGSAMLCLGDVLTQRCSREADAENRNNEAEETA